MKNFLKKTYGSPLGIACLIAAALVLLLVFGFDAGEVPQFEQAR